MLVLCAAFYCERQARRTIRDKRSAPIKFWRGRSRRKWQIHSPRCAISPVPTLISPSLTCSHSVSLFLNRGDSRKSNPGGAQTPCEYRYRIQIALPPDAGTPNMQHGITSNEHFTSKAREQKRYYRIAITEKLAYAALVNVSRLDFTRNSPRGDITILIVIPGGYKITAAIDVPSENQPIVREY